MLLAMGGNGDVLFQKGEGESFWVLGDLYTFKATGKQTNGAYTLIEQVIQPQNGPPPHVHHSEDEAFYVLEGKFSFMMNGEENVVDAGGFVRIPRGTLHTFKNISDKPGRLLVFISPAGLEEFFYAIGTPASGAEAPPVFDPAVIAKVMKLAGRYKMDVVMPEGK